MSGEWRVLPYKHHINHTGTVTVRQSNYSKIKSQHFNKRNLIRCIFRCEGRRESGVESTAGWSRPCLLSSFWFTGRTIFYSSTAPAEIFLKTKQKYFPTAFKLSWCDGEAAGDDPVIRVSPSTPAALWCPPAWLATTRVPPCTRPLSTATKVRSPWVRLEPWQPHCVQVTPDRLAGEEFSTSQLITNNNCRVRDLRLRDTTTTIIGQSAVTLEQPNRQTTNTFPRQWWQSSDKAAKF